MKTLFLKSNILHIRTNEGEFEVSPECYTKGISRDGENYWYNVDTGTTTVGIGEKEKFEWPYGVELIEHYYDKNKGVCGITMCYSQSENIKDKCLKWCKTVARLLPEEKKEQIFIDGDFNNSYESRVRKAKGRKKIEELSNDKMDVYEEGHYLNFQPKDSAHSFTESAYKEVESSEPQEKDYFKCPSCGDRIRYGLTEQTREAFRKSKLFARIELDETKRYVDKQLTEPVSAPSESQEEMWKIVYGASNTITRDGFIESMKEHFKITRKPE